jgi:predicted RNA-binding Zn-ribbon protein involved in translation (DUF1610 family)
MQKRGGANKMETIVIIVTSNECSACKKEKTSGESESIKICPKCGRSIPTEH